METVNANAACLSNYEVLEVLKEIRDNHKKSSAPLPSVIFEALKYLQDTDYEAQSPEMVKNLLRAYEKFNLTKGEKLMLINNPPRKDIDVRLMVEESEERLTDEQVKEILVITEQHHPFKSVDSSMASVDE